MKPRRLCRACEYHRGVGKEDLLCTRCFVLFKMWAAEAHPGLMAVLDESKPVVDFSRPDVQVAFDQWFGALL